MVPPEAILVGLAVMETTGTPAVVATVTSAVRVTEPAHLLR